MIETVFHFRDKEVLGLETLTKLWGEDEHRRSYSIPTLRNDPREKLKMIGECTFENQDVVYELLDYIFEECVWE